MAAEVSCNVRVCCGISYIRGKLGLVGYSYRSVYSAGSRSSYTNPIIYPDIKEAFSLPSSARYVTQYIRGGISRLIDPLKSTGVRELADGAKDKDLGRVAKYCMGAVAPTPELSTH
jgi:hypothetical protein